MVLVGAYDKANFEQRRARNFDLGGPPAEAATHQTPVATNDPAVRLSVCMIVRDSSRTLPACLASIRPWVDEIVVVDTGSKDDTPQIAESFGARVFHFPWCDDFSAARNESLRHARGKWLFWMDSDDTIDEANGKKLRALADQPIDAAPMAYVIQVHCPGKHADGSDVTVVDHVKMFRSHPDIRFEGRIHEQVLLSIRRLDGKLAWTDVFVVHSGSDHSEEGRRRKQDRDLRLLKLELEDRPDHPFALFNLGMTHADMGDHKGAVEALQQSLGVSKPVESHVRKVYALLVASLTELERYDEAGAICAQGRKHYPRDPELSFRQGILLHRAGRFDDAVAAYRSSLEDADEPHFSSIDVGVTGYKARHNLAIVYEDMGKAELAELQWRMALNEMPGFRPAWRGLGSSLVSQGKTNAAAIEAELAFDRPNLRCEALMLQAELSKASGDSQGAGQALQRAVQEFPGDHTALDMLCQLLFEQGHMAEAEPLLTSLAELKPDDGAVLCNLGAVCHHNGHDTKAVQAYRRSISVRPQSVPTRIQLGKALLQRSKTDEAIEVLREAEAMAPGDAAVQEALQGAVTSGQTRFHDPHIDFGSAELPLHVESGIIARSNGPAESPSSPEEALLALQKQLGAQGFYSQTGQDRLIVERLLPHNRGGVFVDLGAHDGITFSNTLYLERHLDWTGLAVEPLADVYGQLVRNRRCVTIQGCVAATTGTARFQSISGAAEMLSGLTAEQHPRHIERIEREMKQGGGEACELEVPCYRLADLLTRYNIDRIDYLSIDVEGAEYSILRDFDFERFPIAVIGVENNYQDSRIPQLLAAAGFKFHSVVGDEFYVGSGRRNG